jgi:translation elongation factor EF-G
MQEGGLAGYPVRALKATLIDGKFHAKDSSSVPSQTFESAWAANMIQRVDGTHNRRTDADAQGPA